MVMDTKTLIQHAMTVRDHAYTPYSKFKVGSALLAKDGTIYAGCNVENASYGMSNCAERTALFSAIAAGQRPGSFAGMAIVGDTVEPIAPCGACRQVLLELCDPQMPVILSNLKQELKHTTVSELLPNAFRITN